MIWQDMLFTAGNVGFTCALIINIRSPHKPALKSCLITSSILTAFAVAFYTMGYMYSCIAGGLNAGLWFVLAYQRWRLNCR